MDVLAIVGGKFILDHDRIGLWILEDYENGLRRMRAFFFFSFEMEDRPHPAGSIHTSEALFS
jgi:hypothetical protein